MATRTKTVEVSTKDFTVEELKEDLRSRGEALDIENVPSADLWIELYKRVRHSEDPSKDQHHALDLLGVTGVPYDLIAPIERFLSIHLVTRDDLAAWKRAQGIAA